MRQTDGETDKDRQRDKQTKTERDTQAERQRQTEEQTEEQTERDKTDRQRDGEKETETGRQAETIIQTAREADIRRLRQQRQASETLIGALLLVTRKILGDFDLIDDVDLAILKNSRTLLRFSRRQILGIFPEWPVYPPREAKRPAGGKEPCHQQNED